jgi:leucyl-tRNA synthetase
MVLAPEHPLVDQITTDDQKTSVMNYKESASQKSDLERQELSKEKTGVFTGAYAINPVSGVEIPVWIADYVLAHYGTGAIMAVPGQDERDWEFAETFDLPILRTVEVPEDFNGKAYTGDGPCINSDFLNGLEITEAKTTIIEWLEKNGVGQKSVNYKLRDWLFSRQRYWGEPFPIIHVNGQPKSLPESELPVTLPQVDDFQPTQTGEPPLARAKNWVETTDPETGEKAIRETNTMPQWAGSCWYYLRYISPNYEGGPVDKQQENYWMPVDLYVGGSEHSVLHLLYARFWHKVLYDCGVVSTKEPFQRLVHQGMILGEVEYTSYEKDGKIISSEKASETENVKRISLSDNEVEKKGDRFVMKGTEITVDSKAHKMSKSRGNVINPDDVVKTYGADSLRLYEMFMGPLEQVKPWSTKGVEGVNRFLNRSWRLFFGDNEEQVLNISDSDPTSEQLKTLHEAIKKVTEDIENMRFNTAISALMIFVNEAINWKSIPKSVADSFVILLSPFSPHIAEEIWNRLGHKNSIAYEEWPQFNEDYLKSDSIELPVQVNGKVRANITIPSDRIQDKGFVIGLAKQHENIQKYLDGTTMIKEIFVPGRIVNLVVK